jgi:hypothetical protein
MKKTIRIISYILSIILFLYLIFVNGWMIYWYIIGGKAFIYYPYLPLTDDYAGEISLQPIIITEIYIIITAIYFIRMDWKTIKT